MKKKNAHTAVAAANKNRDSNGITDIKVDFNHINI